jgi:tetratricopeptide (TPR) repeat protein
VGYSGADDPQLVTDLRAALRRWHSPRLGDAALATRLIAVEGRLAADPRLSRAAALQGAIRAGLAQLREGGQSEQAALLEEHYLHGWGLYRLGLEHHLSERSLSYRLHDAVAALAQALWSAEPAEAAPRPSPGIPTPGIFVEDRARHLPPPSYTRLFGVEGYLTQLLEHLDAPDDHWLICVEGLGGLGKTALAREAAGHAATGSRFAGIAWLTAKREFYTWRGLEESERPALTFEQLLDGIGEQLGDSRWGPLPLAANQERVGALLRAKPYLVVVDNLETAADCEALPGHLWALARPTKFLLTSRHRMVQGAAACPGMSTVPLQELPEADGLALLRYEGRQRGLREVGEAGDEALRPILAVTGGHPLALKLVVGLLASLPLDRVLARLQESGSHADPFYQFLYRPSWELLTDAGKHLLRTMALLPVTGGFWEDLSAASGLPDPQLAGAIEDLVDHSLLQAGGLAERRYSIHRLTHRFVLSRVMPPELFVEGVLRLGEHYLACARRDRDDWATLERHRDTLLQAVELCCVLMKDPSYADNWQAGSAARQILVESARVIGPYMLRRGSPGSWQPCLEMAVQAARDLGDEMGEADLLNQMGQLKGLLDDRDAALALHRQAAEAFHRLGDSFNLACSLRFQGNIHYARDDRPSALACYEGARDLLAGLDEPRELSHVHNNIANLHFNNRDWSQALLYYERALALLDPEEDQPYTTPLLSNIALLHWEMGEWRQATEDLLTVLPLQIAGGDRVCRANTHHYLCLTYADLEVWEEALFHGRQALALRLALGSDEGLADLYTDLAGVYSHLGDRTAAEAFLVQAWPLWQSLGRADGLARVCLARGDLHGQTEQWSQAQSFYQEALGLLGPTSDLPRRLLAVVGLARACAKSGNMTAGQAWLPRAEALVEELARPDFRVQALWLRAELYPSSARQTLEQALALCDVSGNDRFAWLRRQTAERLAALGGLAGPVERSGLSTAGDQS